MPAVSAPILFSAASDYLSTAFDEVRAAFPDAHTSTVGPDLGSVTADGLSIADVAEAARQVPFIFVRHLMRQVGFVPAADMPTADAVADGAAAIWDGLPLPEAVSLQVWSSGEHAADLRTDDVRKTLEGMLKAAGFEVARSGKDHVLSVVLTAKGAAIGFNTRASALSDWPGGQVRLAKPKGQISRSEFKLEELFREYAIDLPESGRALDLGASPGGWTRILRQRGLDVWAVDPAELHPSLQADAGVRHVRSTASPFLAKTDLWFDLVVNDMRMTPELSSQMMLDAARTMEPGGMIILTLKLTPAHPAEAVRQSLRLLDRWYEIVLVRQLHHNRHEVTVVGRKRTEHRRG